MNITRFQINVDHFSSKTSIIHMENHHGMNEFDLTTADLF